MVAGEPFGLKPGHTSSIRRIEGAMLSYHADMDIKTNPFELGLDRLVSLDTQHDFIGKAALEKIKRKGITRKHVGLVFDGDNLQGPNTNFWPLEQAGKPVGKVTSAVYSPRLEKNIALAMVDLSSAEIGTALTIFTQNGLTQNDIRQATVVEMPFYDPKKQITKS